MNRRQTYTESNDDGYLYTTGGMALTAALFIAAVAIGFLVFAGIVMLAAKLAGG
jgi:hypothetical protein